MQDVDIEALGESIGRNTAKWLLKADLSKTNQELKEEVLSEMGFFPIEITDLLYPSLEKSKRRAKSQKISKKQSKKKR